MTQDQIESQLRVYDPYDQLGSLRSKKRRWSVIVPVVGIALAVAAGVGAALISTPTRHENATPRGEYQHCTDSAKSDSYMEEFGYTLLSVEHNDDGDLLQHWRQREPNTKLPKGIDMLVFAGHACIANQEWQ